MSKYFVFIFVFFCFSTAAFADGDAVSTAEVSDRAFDAGLELETGSRWRSPEIQGLEHDLTLTLGWRVSETIKLGLEGEASLAQEESGGGFKDSEFTVLRKDLSLGRFGKADFGSLTLLPSSELERKAGLIVAQGAMLAWELEAFSGLTFGYEAKGLSFFRSIRDLDVLKIALGSDKARLEQSGSLALQLFRGLGFQASAKHISSWKWLEGREATLELEQKISYEFGQWSMGFGHRSETLLLAQNGERRGLALSRAEESKLFGTLAWTL